MPLDVLSWFFRSYPTDDFTSDIIPKKYKRLNWGGIWWGGAIFIVNINGITFDQDTWMGWRWVHKYSISNRDKTKPPLLPEDPPSAYPGFWGYFFFYVHPKGCPYYMSRAIKVTSMPNCPPASGDSVFFDWTHSGATPDPESYQRADTGSFLVRKGDRNPRVLVAVQPTSYRHGQQHQMSGLSLKFIPFPDLAPYDRAKLIPRPRWPRPRYYIPGPIDRGRIPFDPDPGEFDDWYYEPIPQPPWGPPETEEPPPLIEPPVIIEEPADPGLPSSPPTPIPKTPWLPVPPRDTPGPVHVPIPGSSADPQEVRSVLRIYKDYDIGYDNQNVELEPVVVMGGPVVANADEVIALSAENSWSLSSKIKAFSWDIADGVVVSGDLTSPSLTVKWATGGQRTIGCTVTNDLGLESTGYRNVYVYSDSVEPIQQFEIESLAADLGTGWSAEVRVLNPSNPEWFKGGREVVIFAERIVQGAKENLSVEPNDYQLVFRGWIAEGSVVRDPIGHWISFRAIGPLELLDTQENFGIALIDVESAIDWTEFPSLTTYTALFHLLKWHSTILDITDVHIPHFNWSEMRIAGQDFSQGSILQQARSLTEAMFVSLSSSKEGSIWVTLDPTLTPKEMLEKAVNNWLPSSLTAAKVQEEFSFVENKLYQANQVELSGIKYLGTDSRAIIVSSPGTTPLYGGTPETYEKKIIYSTEDAMRRAAYLLSLHNRKVEEVSAMVPGNLALDLAPPRLLQITHVGGGIDWTNQQGVLTSLARELDPETGVLAEELSVLPLPDTAFRGALVSEASTVLEALPPDTEGPDSVTLVDSSRFGEVAQRFIDDPNVLCAFTIKTSDSSPSRLYYSLMPEEFAATDDGVQLVDAERDIIGFDHRPGSTEFWLRQADGELVVLSPNLPPFVSALKKTVNGRTWDIDYLDTYDPLLRTNHFSLYGQKGTDCKSSFVTFDRAEYIYASRPLEEVNFPVWNCPASARENLQPYIRKWHTLPLHRSVQKFSSGDRSEIGYRVYTSTFIPFIDRDTYEWGIAQTILTTTVSGSQAKPVWDQRTYIIFQEDRDYLMAPNPSVLILAPPFYEPIDDQYVDGQQWPGQIMVFARVWPRGGKLTEYIGNADIMDISGKTGNPWVAFALNTIYGNQYGTWKNWPDGVPRTPIQSNIGPWLPLRARIGGDRTYKENGTAVGYECYYGAYGNILISTNRMVFVSAAWNADKSEVDFTSGSGVMPREVYLIPNYEEYVPVLRASAQPDRPDLWHLLLLNRGRYTNPAVYTVNFATGPLTQGAIAPTGEAILASEIKGRVTGIFMDPVKGAWHGWPYG